MNTDATTNAEKYSFINKSINNTRILNRRMRLLEDGNRFPILIA